MPGVPHALQSLVSPLHESAPGQVQPEIDRSRHHRPMSRLQYEIPARFADRGDGWEMEGITLAMSWKEVQLDALKRIVNGQKRVFATKDVSQDKRIQDAHPALARHAYYHAFVGAALSRHRVALGIKEIRKSTSRGSIWEQQDLSAAFPLKSAGNSVASDGVSSEDSGADLGPQYRGDSLFAARMRRHQSWYRAAIMKVPYGTGPTPASKSRYGNMLTRLDADGGLNFLTPEIAQMARERVAQGGGTVESFRLFRNMLSSQPMCFNLFGLFINNRQLACRLLAPLVPEKMAEVTRVAIEWAPEPRNAYLDDRTAFDAFIEYRDVDRRLYALGIETKLSEPFSQKEYDGERYRRWMRVQDSPWRPEADSTVHAIKHNQLWRDHLLVVALSHQEKSPYTKTRLMLVRHPEDRECANVLAGYGKLLRDKDDSLIDMPLDSLIDTWRSVIGEGPEREWIQAFRVRYLELESSASMRAWDHVNKGGENEI
jgi:hypothetical protein